MRYFRAPVGYEPDGTNPFSSDGHYGSDWVGLHLTDEDQSFIGESKTGLFFYRFNRKLSNIECIAADFLRYENEHNRNAIFFVPEDIDMETFVDSALANTPKSHVLRDSDPKYLVHTTSLGAAKEILRDGEVKSLSKLSQEGRDPKWHRLRSACLGEPPEYGDHINLGAIDDLWCEVVPASHTNGQFMTLEDEYEPGMRFYFDAHRIIQAGLDIRIVGAIKVFDSLALSPFLITSVSLDDIDPDRKINIWTPKFFTEQANKVFMTRLQKKN